MIPTNPNSSIAYTDNISESDSINFNNASLNFNISLFSNLYNTNHNINNNTQDPSFNINYSPETPLIIDNYNKPNTSGNIEKQTNNSTKDWKSVQKRLVSAIGKKIKFKVEDAPSPQINKLRNSLIQKKIGRKKKDDTSKRNHNKFTDDNVRRKCKHLVLNCVKDFINEKIKFLYNDDIGNSIFKKQLLSFNKEQKFNATIEYNKLFLYKKLKEIFSETISTRFTNYDSNHNKILIEKLENDRDEYKSQYFKRLFNFTFIDCVKHFRRIHYFKELDGMKCFDEVKEQFSGEKEYVEILSYYLENYEEIIKRKKARKSTKKLNEENMIKKDENNQLSFLVL